MRGAWGIDLSCWTRLVGVSLIVMLALICCIGLGLLVCDLMGGCCLLLCESCLLPQPTCLLCRLVGIIVS